MFAKVVFTYIMFLYKNGHLIMGCSVICQFISDKWLDDNEVAKLRRLFHCLFKFGQTLRE